jgi:hypothetical protein
MMVSFFVSHWRAVVLVAVATALWGHGNLSGRKACVAEHQQEVIDSNKRMFAAAERASREESKRLVAEAEREALAKTLEDEAYAEPVSSDCGLPASRVLRLDSR